MQTSKGKQFDNFVSKHLEHKKAKLLVSIILQAYIMLKTFQMWYFVFISFPEVITIIFLTNVFFAILLTLIAIYIIFWQSKFYYAIIWIIINDLAF